MTFSIRFCEVAMTAAVVTALEALGVLLAAAGFGVVVAALVGGAAGVGCGLLAAAVVCVVAAWLAARS